jgi:cell division cycle 14
MPFN